jgi:hypothetical protein
MLMVFYLSQELLLFAYNHHKCKKHITQNQADMTDKRQNLRPNTNLKPRILLHSVVDSIGQCNASFSTWAGVLKSRVFLGREFSFSATSFS